MIKNFYQSPVIRKAIHDGNGMIESVQLFGADDLKTGLRYVSFSKIPPGASIGYHGHPNEREEIYVILQGCGLMSLDDQKTRVVPGDVILTKIGMRHGLENDGEESLDVFIFWVEK